MQTQLNNSLNVNIELTSNEINYEFKIKEVIFLLNNQQSMTNNLIDRRLKHRTKIAETTMFVIIKVKIYYDARHTSLLIQLDDKAYLRLHHKYQLFEKSNRKLSLQRCESFFIKRRVDRLTYELKLSSI